MIARLFYSIFIKMRKLSVIITAMLMISCGSGSPSGSGGSDYTVWGKISGAAASGKQVQVSFGTEVKAIAAINNGDFTISLPVPDKKILSVYDRKDASITPADAKYIMAQFSVIKDDEIQPLMIFGENIGYAEFIYLDRDVSVSAKNNTTMYLFKGWNIVVNRYQSFQKKWYFTDGPLPGNFAWVTTKEGLAAIAAMTNTDDPGWFNGTYVGKLNEESKNRVKTVAARGITSSGVWTDVAKANVVDGRFTFRFPTPDNKILIEWNRINLFSGVPETSLLVSSSDLKLLELELWDVNSDLKGVWINFLYADMDASIKGYFNLKIYELYLKKGWNFVVYRHGAVDDIIKTEPVPDNMIWKSRR